MDVELAMQGILRRCLQQNLEPSVVDDTYIDSPNLYGRKDPLSLLMDVNTTHQMSHTYTDSLKLTWTKRGLCVC